MDHLNTMKASRSGREINHNDTPNIFSLMGYEVGLIISNYIDCNHSIPALINECLKSKHINSPRGTLAFNSFNESQVTTIKLRKFNYNKIKYHNTAIDTIDASFTEDLYQKFKPIPDSGWRNPYICT